jgi:hypothetical protein
MSPRHDSDLSSCWHPSLLDQEVVHPSPAWVGKAAVCGSRVKGGWPARTRQMGSIHQPPLACGLLYQAQGTGRRTREERRHEALDEEPLHVAKRFLYLDDETTMCSLVGEVIAVVDLHCEAALGRGGGPWRWQSDLLKGHTLLRISTKTSLVAWTDMGNVAPGKGYALNKEQHAKISKPVKAPDQTIIRDASQNHFRDPGPTLYMGRVLAIDPATTDR